VTLDPRTYRVFLVGADTLAWDGLRTIVARMPEVQLVGETFDPRGAAEAAAEAAPDTVLLGSPLQGRSSSGLARLLHERCPGARIVVLADDLELDDLPTYAAARISGYLVVSALNAAALQLGLRAVLQAKLVVLVDAVAAAIGEALSTGTLPAARYPAIVLKDREQAVLRGLAAGLTREEIAAAEHLSVRTVERIVATLAVQFDAPSAFVLGMKAARLRLVG
jgi:two-component system nitrate/nitrite response regulator NarL